jgi:two-component system, sensor histidine kinase and response regulator
MNERTETPHILIVDDQEVTRHFLRTRLEAESYEISEAAKGFDVLDMVRQSRPDLILLDIAMPGIDGFDVCKRLKADPDTRPIPVIFLTGKTKPDDVNKGFELGGLDYVTKPFNITELLARVNTHLTLYKMQKESEQNARLQTLGLVTRSIAHEVRNMMQVINGYVDEVLHEGKLDQKYREKLEIAKKSGEELTEFMKKFLALAQGNVDFQEFEFHEAIDTALEIVSSRLKHKQTQIERRFTPDGTNIEGERALIQYAIVNLIYNSLDAIARAMRPGKLTVYTEVNERTLTFSIQDNGIGIAPPQIPKLFDIGYTTKTTGMGFGLAFCQYCIEKVHGGTIRVESQRGDGTKVTIEIPKK